MLSKRWCSQCLMPIDEGTVRAVVVPQAGANLTIDGLHAYLAPYKRPTQTAFKDAIPKTAVGKILRGGARTMQESTWSNPWAWQGLPQQTRTTGLGPGGISSWSGGREDIGVVSRPVALSP